jgi:hypothetical protein
MVTNEADDASTRSRRAASQRTQLSEERKTRFSTIRDVADDDKD